MSNEQQVKVDRSTSIEELLPLSTRFPNTSEASVPSQIDIGDRGCDSAQATHNFEIANEAGAPSAASEWVLASDIVIDPSFHDRRAYSTDDLERAKAVVAQPGLLAPLRVFARGNCLVLVDGYITLQAVLALDENSRVKVDIVNEEDVVSIRLADTRRRHKLEPMTVARQALARKRAGLSQDEIAKELFVTAGNVSQMVSAAEAEERFEQLAQRIPDRSKLSRAFWFEMHTTVLRAAKLDGQNSDGSTPAMDRFMAVVNKLIAAKTLLSADEVRKQLRFNALRSAPKRRNRMIGEPIKNAACKVQLHVARERQAGPIINFPPGFPIEKFDEALGALVAILIEQEKRDGSAAKN